MQRVGLPVKAVTGNNLNQLSKISVRQVTPVVHSLTRPVVHGVTVSESNSDPSHGTVTSRLTESLASVSPPEPGLSLPDQTVTVTETSPSHGHSPPVLSLAGTPALPVAAPA